MLPLTFAGAGLSRRMDRARPGSPRLRHLSRFLPFIGPVRPRLRRRFPPVSRFRRCRRSQVSGKRSKPLTSYRRKHKMANQKPVDEIRIGRVKATTWRNGTDEQPRHNVTFSRLYKDGDQWKSTQSFGRNDLLVLAKVADLAHLRIFSLPRKKKRRPRTSPKRARIQSAAGTGPAASSLLSFPPVFGHIWTMSTLSLLCPNPLPRCRFPLFPRIALFWPGPRRQRTAVGSLRALDRYGPCRGAGSTTREKGGSAALVAGGDLGVWYRCLDF